MDMKSIWSRYQTYILVVILILVTFISYANVYSNQFLWDDEQFIQKNTFIQDFSHLADIFTSNLDAGAGVISNFYRPTQQIFYLIIHSIFGLSTSAFHFLNIALHASNAVLIFLLFSLIFKNQFISFLTALLWTTNPLHTEAITYMSGTADPLFLFFGLSAFLSYVLWRRHQHFSLIITSLCLFIVSLLAKETAITLPVLILLYEFAMAPKKISWNPYKWTLPFFTISGIYFLLRLTVFNFLNSFSLYVTSNIYTEHLPFRIYTFLASLPSYYFLLFYPYNLHMERSFPVFTTLLTPSIIASLIILVILAFFFYRSVKNKNPYLQIAIPWFYISFLPMSGLIPSNSFLLEHWLYLPSISFFLIVSYLIYLIYDRFSSFRTILIIFITLLISSSIFLSLRQNLVWQTPISFYNNILKYEKEGTARVFNNLAMAYADEGNLPLAETNYLKAISIADIYPQIHYNLARLYLAQDNTGLAIEHLNSSIRIEPSFYLSHYLLGTIYEEQNQLDKATKSYDYANKFYPY